MKNIFAARPRRTSGPPQFPLRLSCSSIAHFFWLPFFCWRMGWAALSAAGQDIGCFPEMCGGFEAEFLQSPFPVLSSGGSNGTWTVENTKGSGFISSPQARSGDHYAVLSVTGTTRFTTPLLAKEAVSPWQTYIGQFFYRTAGLTNAPTVKLGLACDSNGNMNYSGFCPLNATTGTWVKVWQQITTPLGAGTGIAAIRFPYSAAGTVDIDDLVFYPGTQADTAPPSPPGPVAVHSTAPGELTVSWSAAPGGVDGGGYLAVRNTSDPYTPPNPNGLYRPGNVLGSGPGSGTVVYVGTNTWFCETNAPSGPTGYYRVYTVDKAFNYSTPSLGSPQPLLLPLTLSNSTVLVRFSGLAGRTYVVESAESLAGPWTGLGTYVFGGEASFAQHLDERPCPAVRFYRVRQLGPTE